MSSDNDPPAFRHLPGVRSTLDFIGQERFVGARSATTSNPLRSMRSPPPSPRRPTMPLWTSESTRPGLTRRFNDAFNGFRQQTLPPLAYPASRTNLDGLISFPNADLNRRRTLPGSPPRRPLLTLISAPSRPLPRVQCTSSIPITRISGQSVGPPNNAIRFPPLPATRGSSPEAFVEKKSRQGRHRTACDRCRGRKSKCDQEDPCSTCKRGRVGHLCAFTKETDTTWSNFDIDGDPPRRRAKRAKRNHRGASQPRFDDTVNAKQESNHDSVDADQTLVEFEDEGVLLSSEHRNQSSSTFEHHEPSLGSPPSSFATTATLPISSERDNPIINLHPSSPSPTRPIWSDEIDEAHLSAGAQVSSGYSSNEWSENDLMEEDECRNVGSRRHHQGPRPENAESEKTFFGTSHFGPQLAAKYVAGKRNTPPVSFGDDCQVAPRGVPQIDDTQPYTLVTQIRSLLALLPRREQCDKYVQCYFERYNDHMDILYRPEFDTGYEAFWRETADVTKISQIDLRQFALMLIVIAFGVLLDHNPNAFDERRQFVEDLRLIGHEASRVSAMMEDLAANNLGLQDREELSLCWAWAAKKALSEASGFYGESIDTVKAGAMIALYMIISRRVTEGWTAIGTAVRAAQAQGMHVDGASWERMSLMEAELRRRLWAQLYTMDRSVSLFLGRPLAIQDCHFTTHEPANVTDHDLTSLSNLPRPFDRPIKSTFLILHFRLARIIGQIQCRCFGLHPREYNDVLDCENMLDLYSKMLPPHFRLEAADTSLDGHEGYRWLRPQRQTLISKFHLARISLHRPYLLRSFGKRSDPQFMPSREACLLSSIADINIRTTLTDTDPLDRFKWMTVASGFNPATIIGILCVYGYRDERFDRDYLLNVLRDYISAEEKTVRRDERLESELRVLQMMVEKATASRRKHHRHTILPAPIPASAPTLTPPFPPLVFVDSEWVNATRINDPDRPSAFAFDDFLLPPEWDGTAQPMPESNDWDGWTNVMAYVSGVEESRMS